MCMGYYLTNQRECTLEKQHVNSVMVPGFKTNSQVNVTV